MSMSGVELLNTLTAIVSHITYIYLLLISTWDLVADDPIRQGIAHWVPRLSKRLNELDSSFELPVEEPYTFEHELRAREMLEAAFSKYISETPADSPTPHVSGDPSAPINGGDHGTGPVAGDDHVVIEMSVMPSVVANGAVNNAESREESTA
jgi:hypothetical protein